MLSRQAELSGITRGRRLAPVCALLCLAACATDDDAHHQSDGRVPAQVSALTSERDALRSRIDLEHSDLDLRVEASEIPAQQALDTGAFMAALAQLASQEPASDSVWTGDGFSHFVIGTQTARFIAATRYIDVHDSRGYASETAANPSDAELAAVGESLMGALGIESGESVVKVVALGSESKDSSSETGSRVERMGRKAFFFRELGGVPVAGARMVFSFAPDGSLRHIRGWWPVLDLAHSQTVSTLSEDAVVERALDALIEGRAAAESSVPITIESFLQVDEGEATPTVRLRAAALTHGIGPEGPTRGVRYEFDI